MKQTLDSIRKEIIESMSREGGWSEAKNLMCAAFYLYFQDNPNATIYFEKKKPIVDLAIRAVDLETVEAGSLSSKYGVCLLNMDFIFEENKREKEEFTRLLAENEKAKNSAEVRFKNAIYQHVLTECGDFGQYLNRMKNVEMSKNQAFSKCPELELFLFDEMKPFFGAVTHRNNGIGVFDKTNLDDLFNFLGSSLSKVESEFNSKRLRGEFSISETKLNKKVL